MSQPEPPSTLPRGNKLGELKVDIPFVDCGQEKQTCESDTIPVMAASSIHGADQAEPYGRDVTTTATEEKGMDETEKPVGYPKGIELVFIILALVLSISLMSLDQVSSTTTD